MKKNRIQVILDDGTLDEFKKEAKKQNRTESALARNYIINGISNDKLKPKTDK